MSSHCQSSSYLKMGCGASKAVVPTTTNPRNNIKNQQLQKPASQQIKKTATVEEKNARTPSIIVREATRVVFYY
jgi:hypothetical protein